MTAITAAVLRELGAPLELEQLELDAPAADEVRVRLHGVGICQTDLAALTGKMPRPLPTVLGHEGSGVVEAVGAAVTTLAVGDTVVLAFDHCGSCRWCDRGRPAYCETFVPRNYAGARLDGSLTLADAAGGVHGNWLGQSSFATHALATERSAVKVDSDLPLELLGPLACGLPSGAGAVLNVLKPEAGDVVAVFGLGSVGLAALLAARAVGCEVVGVDPAPGRRGLAEELGAFASFDPTEGDVVRTIRKATKGGAHASVDAVGIGSVVAQALGVLRSPGLCATVGFQGGRNEVAVDQGHLLFGRGLLGVVEGDMDPQRFIPELLALQAQGRFPFERLIRTYAFEAINDAIDDARAGTVVKPVLRCNSGQDL